MHFLKNLSNFYVNPQLHEATLWALACEDVKDLMAMNKSFIAAIADP